ncbi:MAG: hypothetical protein Tsb002_08390 [Wenzhouxiangellaceae bacterium]
MAIGTDDVDVGSHPKPCNWQARVLGALVRLWLKPLGVINTLQSQTID